MGIRDEITTLKGARDARNTRIRMEEFDWSIRRELCSILKCPSDTMLLRRVAMKMLLLEGVLKNK